jgi:hypothetical protein
MWFFYLIIGVIVWIFGNNDSGQDYPNERRQNRWLRRKHISRGG